MFKKFRYIAVPLLFAVLLACPTWLAAQQSTQELKIATFTWPGHGPFYVAEQLGFFEDAGVKVKLLRMDSAPERRAALAAGRIDGAATTLDEVILINNNVENKLKVVFETDQSNGADGVVAKKDIKTIADLKGKRVAFQGGVASQIFLMQVLKKAELTLKDVVWIHMSPEEAGAAFTSGKVDAAVTWEPWLSKANAMSDGHILISTAEVPGLIAAVLTVREINLQKNNKAWRAVTKAWFRAVKFCRDNPEKAHKIMAKVFELPVPDIKAMLMVDTIAGEKENLAYFGKKGTEGQIYEIYKAISANWKELGMIDKVLPPQEIIYPDFVREIVLQ